MCAAQVTLAGPPRCLGGGEAPPRGFYGEASHRASAPTPQLHYMVVGDGSGRHPGTFWTPAGGDEHWCWTPPAAHAAVASAAATTGHLPAREPFWPINGTAPPPTPPAATRTFLTAQHSASRGENLYSVFDRPPADTSDCARSYVAAARSHSATDEARGAGSWGEGLRAQAAARSAECIGLPPGGGCGECGGGCGGGGCISHRRPRSSKKSQRSRAGERAGEGRDAGEVERRRPSLAEVGAAEEVEGVEVVVEVETRRRRESTFFVTQPAPDAEGRIHAPTQDITPPRPALASQEETACRRSTDAGKHPSADTGECIRQPSVRKGKAKGKKAAIFTFDSAEALLLLPSGVPAPSDPAACERNPLVSQGPSNCEDDALVENALSDVVNPPEAFVGCEGDDQVAAEAEVGEEAGVEAGLKAGAGDMTTSNASASSWRLDDGLAWELWYEQKLKEEGARRRKEEKRQRTLQAQEEARQQEEEQRRLLAEENRKAWLERKRKQEEEDRRRAERQKEIKEQQEMQRKEQRLQLCQEYMRKAQEKKEEMRKAEAQQRAQEEQLRAEAESRRQAQKQRSLEQWRARSARHARPLTGAIFNRDAQPAVPKPAFDFYNPEPWQF